MSTFVITGMAGFLASHVAKHLIDDSHMVIGIDNLSGGYISNVPANSIFIEGDITDPVLVEHVYKKYKPDYTMHFAAYAAEGLSHWIRNFNYTNNVIGSTNLINASIKYGVKSFIFTSSMAVYGTQQVPYREDQKPQPEDPYGIAKYSIEQDLEAARRMFGLNYIIFRPHNIYGPHQNISDRYRNVIGIFMRQIMQGKDITVFGDGEQTRAFSYINDMSPIMAKSYSKKDMYGQIFNIGGDKPYSINEIADAVIDAMGEVGTIKYLPERFEVKHAHSNHDNIRKHFELGQTPLNQGIAEMAKWAKTVKLTPLKNMKLELDKKLYEAWR